MILQARLLDTVEQAIAAADPNGVIIYWNRFAELLYQQPAAQVVGRNLSTLITSPVLAAQVTGVVDHLRKGAGWSGELSIKRRDGAHFPVHVNATPLLRRTG